MVVDLAEMVVNDEVLHSVSNCFVICVAENFNGEYFSVFNISLISFECAPDLKVKC